MTNPDGIVEENGRDVELERVVDPVYDVNDVLDKEQSTIETETIKAIVSQPSERDMTRLEGKVGVAELKLTVKSDVDVTRRREGSPDSITVDGRKYSVADVQRDQHPIVGTEKVTVILHERDGQ